MTAKEEELRRSVERLRHEIESGHPLDSEQRESLQTALAELEKLLSPDDESPEEQPLADQLREYADHFEETHPKLTFAIGAVADALSLAGL